MNITLRKAKDLRDSLWTAINDMTFVTQFEMTEFQMPVNAVAQVEETLTKVQHNDGNGEVRYRNKWQ